MTAAETVSLAAYAVAALAPGCLALACMAAWRSWRASRRRRARGAWRQVVALGPLAMLPGGEDTGS